METALAAGNAPTALGTQPICRDGTSVTDPIGFTIFSAEWCNTPDPKARIAAGPPSQARYREVGF
jgi:hypothetical protein